MSKFNSRKAVRPTLTVNSAGGQAFAQSSLLAFASAAVTTFCNATYYKSEKQKIDDILTLLDKIPLKFAAQTAVFARNEFGMRSVSHVLAAEIAKRNSGSDWGRSFVRSVVRRPDDITEILAYYFKKNKGEKLPQALKRGLADSFGKFDTYQLAKYRGEGRSVSLVDAVNLLHPKPTDKNKSALSKLMKGSLKNTQTWEAKLSATEGDSEAKEEAWASLLTENKLPYMAAVRNARNIIQQAPNLVDKLCRVITNIDMLKKSLILPFNLLSASEEVEKIGGTGSRKVSIALSEAAELALKHNIPKFSGENLIVLDCSGSMTIDKRTMGTASLFASALLKATCGDFIMFGSGAKYVNYDASMPIMSLARVLINHSMGGTNYHAWIKLMNKKYDRIFILSDNEAWMGWKNAETTMASYRSNYNVNPYVYNFDLAGNGTMQFPESKTICLAGFSEKVFDLISLFETEKKAFIKKIQNVEFN